jgi:hypothetical protein
MIGVFHRGSQCGSSLDMVEVASSNLAGPTKFSALFPSRFLFQVLEQQQPIEALRDQHGSTPYGQALMRANSPSVFR